jgi:hypothetical protein
MLPIFIAAMMVLPAPFVLVGTDTAGAPVHNTAAWSGKILHYELYTTDGYINVNSGSAGALTTDPSDIGGWPSPVYTWGFTDVDPGGPLSYNAITGEYLNTQLVPAGALTAAGGMVGNAKFPAPIIEAGEGDDVYITVHNRGFFQDRQAVQDEHTLHLHGIHAQSVYDGFPESAGSYSENMTMFWRSLQYGGDGLLGDGVTMLKDVTNLAVAWPSSAFPMNSMSTKMKDDWWNNMDAVSQQRWLLENASTLPVGHNALSPAGGIPSQFDAAMQLLTPTQRENETQFTYYFRAVTPGSTMYHCHVVASEHVQMGMYGALIIRPLDYIQKDMNHALTLDAVHGNKFFDVNYNGIWDPGEANYTDADGNMIISINDTRLDQLILKPGSHPDDATYTYQAGSIVTVSKTIYGIGTNSEYDVEYIFLLSEIDPVWHQIIERGKGAFYPPNWKPQLWFVNGRTFPETVFNFQFHNPQPSTVPANWGQMTFQAEPRYNTWMSAQQGDRVLERWIGMGYQEHSMHQHGWHMEIVGTDMEQLRDSTGNPYRLVKFTLPISSGETYDVITNVDPVYGEAGYPSGNPLDVSNGTGGTNLKWRALYPIHDHYDYQVTTNGIYPGGALILFEARVTGAQTPATWDNPYTGQIEVLPDAPARPSGPYGY